MSMQDSNATNPENNTNPIEHTPQNLDPSQNMEQQEPFEIPKEKVLSEIDPKKQQQLTEQVAPDSPSTSHTEIMTQPTANAQNAETLPSLEIPEEKVLSEIDREEEKDAPASKIKKQDPIDNRKKIGSHESDSVEHLLSDLEKLVNLPDAGERIREFNQLKDWSIKKISFETDQKRKQFLADGSLESDFDYEHPFQSKLSALTSIFKEKHVEWVKDQEKQFEENLTQRQAILERLKNLYTSSEPGINLFHEIRSIKKDWNDAGQVAKSQFKLLNNDYYYHLNQFYQVLDLNKEYLEQEYVHNLEKRQHIIERAKDLLKEPVQKALNELQYLHKLWKEEGEPVAEEFRESTWNEFRAISNQIHDRRVELHTQMDALHDDNLKKKLELIAQIKGITTTIVPDNNINFKDTLSKVEQIRSTFLKIGSVPKENVNETWSEFKEAVRQFNSAKNKFFKTIKSAQQENLAKKLSLIETAKQNMNSEDWDKMVPLFKNLQSEWKRIGPTPRHTVQSTWNDFREACNIFFTNFRTKSPAAQDNWLDNFKEKKLLMDELSSVTNHVDSEAKIEDIKARWNALGKVPKDRLYIHSQFNKLLREKLKLNNLNEYDLKDENLSESQLTDKARKIKNQIADLETQVTNLETNLSFFKSPGRDNLLLKDTYEKLDEKKEQLERLKASLHHIITGE
ncbi:DUF349 domain-containing protein [Chryseobacterium sp. A321]